MARLGILGGLGHLAGAVFHRRLIERWAQGRAPRCDEDYPQVLHLSAAVAGFDATGICDKAAVAESLAPAFAMFGAFRASFVAIACNSLLELSRELEGRHGLEILTPWAAAPAVQTPWDTVVLSSLSLRGYLGRKQPELRWPTAKEQKIIQESIESVIAGRPDPAPIQGLIDRYLARGFREIRVACTELSCLDLQSHPKVLDTLECLVTESVHRAQRCADLDLRRFANRD